MVHDRRGVDEQPGPNAGGGGGFWDFQTIDEARVQSMGTDAEFPTRGVQINAIVKSGGNEFHGGGLWRRDEQEFAGRQPR